MDSKLNQFVGGDASLLNLLATPAMATGPIASHSRKALAPGKVLAGGRVSTAENWLFSNDRYPGLLRNLDGRAKIVSLENCVNHALGE